MQAGTPPEQRRLLGRGQQQNRRTRFGGRDTHSCLTLSSYFPSSYYIDGRVAKVTDFLKTRLLDTLSDQIRKIQKVSECKGSAGARGHRACSAWAQLRHAHRGAGVGSGGRVAAGPCAPSQNAASPHSGHGVKHQAAQSLAPGWDVRRVLREVATGCSTAQAVQMCWDTGWMHRAGANPMQSPAKAADWLESPICLFLKGAACYEGETELAPQDKETSEQPGGTKPS